MVWLKEKERHEEREKEKHTIYDISDDVSSETQVACMQDIQDGHDMVRLCRQSARLPYNNIFYFYACSIGVQATIARKGI